MTLEQIKNRHISLNEDLYRHLIENNTLVEKLTGVQPLGQDKIDSANKPIPNGLIEELDFELSRTQELLFKLYDNQNKLYSSTYSPESTVSNMQS